MFKKGYILVIVFAFAVTNIYSQTDPKDTIPSTDESLAIDTSFNYDDLMNDFIGFIDSLLAPRSYFLINVSASSSYFNYQRSANDLSRKQQLVVSPTLGYYHKSGPGITVSGNFTDYGEKRKGYQYSISPSFDFIQNRNWIGGISFVRYITRDSLPFYTTPLQNEINGYYLWRKPWLQPGISASFGWGNKSDVKKRERFLRRFLIRRLGIVWWNNNGTATTEESIRDFSVTGSLRHSFYWLDIFGHNDYIKFTPLLTFSAGTQKYGFNQTTGTGGTNLRNNLTELFNSGNVNLDKELKFQALSVTFYLSPQYNIGKFFIQPQLIFDYYFPAEDKKLSTLFSVNAGLLF